MPGASCHGFEYGEEKGGCVEVTCGVLGLGCAGNQFIESRPHVVNLALSDADYLYRIGVELGGEVAGGVTVWQQIKVVPEQVLSEVVGVDQKGCHFCDALGDAAAGRERCNEYGIAGANRSLQVSTGEDHRAVAHDMNRDAVVGSWADRTARVSCVRDEWP